MISVYLLKFSKDKVVCAQYTFTRWMHDKRTCKQVIMISQYWKRAVFRKFCALKFCVNFVEGCISVMLDSIFTATSRGAGAVYGKRERKEGES